MVLADVRCICSNKANMNHYDTTTVFYSQSLSVSSSLIHSFSHYITPWTKRAEPARTSLWEKFQCRSKFFNASFFKTNSEENFINAINRDLLCHHSFIQSCDKQPASQHCCIKCKCRYVKNIQERRKKDEPHRKNIFQGEQQKNAMNQNYCFPMSRGRVRGRYWGKI